MCFLLLFLLPWRLVAAVVLMAADQHGRQQHMLKSSAKAMCNAVGYGLSRMPSFEAAISSACRSSFFVSVELHCQQLQQLCVDIVHDIDNLCGDEESKFSKASCPQKVSSAMAFIVTALRVR
jgi:hypothetical protein